MSQKEAIIIHVGRLNGVIEAKSSEQHNKILESFKTQGVIYVVALKLYISIEHTFTPEFEAETFEAMTKNEYWIEIKSTPIPHPLIDPEMQALAPNQRYLRAVEKSIEFIEPHHIPILR